MTDFNDTTYPGPTADTKVRPHVEQSSGLAGVLFGVMILLAALVAACKEQPIDATGVTVIRDTIRVKSDSVIIRDSINYVDSLVIRDSIFIRDSIVLRDTLIVRDSLVVRDSVRYHDSIRYKDSVIFDTIEVPRYVDVERHAVLRYQGVQRGDTGAAGGPARRTIEIDVTDNLQYTVVASRTGEVEALKLSMSTAIPPEYAEVFNGYNDFQIPFYLRGVTLNIPQFRLLSNADIDTLPLNRHPYEWLAEGNRNGGMMIHVLPGNAATLSQAWTGQSVVVTRPASPGRYVNYGRLRFVKLDPSARTMSLEITSEFYVPYEAAGQTYAELFELSLMMSLGY